MRDSKKELRLAHARWILEQTTFLPCLPTLAGSACNTVPTQAVLLPQYTLPNAPEAAHLGRQQGMSAAETLEAHRKVVFEAEGREFPKVWVMLLSCNQITKINDLLCTLFAVDMT